MEIWLKQGTDAIQIPINPPSFQVAVEGEHQTVNVQTKGSVTILGKRGLKAISLSSFFPAQDYPFAEYAMDRDPYDYVKKIEGWITKTVRLTMTETNINMLTTIQSFTYGEPDGSGDIEYTLSFQEYRPPTYTQPDPEVGPAEQVGSAITQKPTTTKRPAKETPKTYTVKQGDNLWDLAKKFYGSGSKMSKLYGANKSVIEKAAKKHGYASSSNKGVAGWWIFPGTKLVVPK